MRKYLTNFTLFNEIKFLYIKVYVPYEQNLPLFLIYKYLSFACTSNYKQKNN